MEPREAAQLPVPRADALLTAWDAIKSEQAQLDSNLRAGRWEAVVDRVDQVLLRETLQLSHLELAQLKAAARALRERRLGWARSLNGDA